VNDPYFSVDNPIDKPKTSFCPKRRWVVQAVVCIAILVPVWAFLFFPIVTSENFGKPLGRAVPTEPPDEANRVHHPQGFSLVFPPNWEIRAEDSPIIHGYPRSLIPSRASTVIAASKSGRVEPPDMTDFHPTSFQGQLAYERMSYRPGTWDDPPQFTYIMFFVRDACRYELVYSRGADPPLLPEMIRRYFATFQVERTAGTDR
jgi:hypothetical protein